MAMRPEGDSSINQPVHRGTENVNLNHEANARVADVPAGSPLARIGSLTAVEEFNKTFNPADHSADSLMAHLDKNTLDIQTHLAYMASLGARMGKANDQNIASNVLDPAGNEFKIENA